MTLRRAGDRVRLFTRRGFDWTQRYPWIVQSARTSWNADIRARLELPVFDIVDCRCE
jgi:ATP-dependent DNA ligase